MKYVRPFFVVGLICIALFRYVHRSTDDLSLLSFNNKQVVLEGVILEEPEDKRDYQKFTIRPEQIYIKDSSSNSDKKQQKFNSEVLVSLLTHDNISYGDHISIEGMLKKPKVVIYPGGEVFDYPKYLMKDNIFYVMDVKSSALMNHNGGNILSKKLLLLKKNFLDNLAQSLPSPHSFLAGGLVVAGKGSLDKNLQEEFKRVGLIHIVVLSGSNVTIIGQFIIATCSFLPTLLKNIFGAFGIICFAIMAGGSATVIRSVIMSLIGLYANTSGHTYTALWGLLIAALLMITYNPLMLLSDASFQLSFTATLGLILLGKRVEQRLMWLTNKFGFREIISTSIATQIFVTPLILHLSGMFSFIALIVNVLVLPLIPITMLFIFFTGVVSFIHTGIALPFSFITYLFLSYELTIVHFFSALPFAAATFLKPTWFVTGCIYAFYGGIGIYKTKHPP